MSSPTQFSGVSEIDQIAITVGDVAQATAFYRDARGAKNESEPRMIAKMPDHELWLAAVRDLEVNIIELIEEKR